MAIDNNQKLRNVLSAVAVIVVALSPFLIYFLTRGSTATEPEPNVTVASPSPSPSPSPTLPPSPAPVVRADVAVEVLNAGAPAGSARRTGDALKEKGFNVVRVGDLERNVSGYVVYYREDRRLAEEVAPELAPNATIDALPADIRSTADVVVLVGSGSQPSPSPTPRRSPSPSPR